MQGYLAARRRDAKIMQLLEMTRTGVGRYLPCFSGGEAAVEAMRQRFRPGLTRREVRARCDAPRRGRHWGWRGEAGRRMAGWRARASARAPSTHCACPRPAPSSRPQAASFAAGLVESAIGHWRTTCYDEYQRCVQGIRA